MTTVQDIYEAIDSMAPFATAESWDNSGLLLGRKEKQVQRAMFCLDLTRGALTAALRQRADLVLCHHPVIFRPIGSVTGEAVYYPLLQQDVALIAAHTNLDQAQQGVNTALIAGAGLSLSPCQPELAPPYLKFCDLPAPVSPEELGRKICSALSLSGLRISDSGSMVTRAAICAGAGGEFWREALKGGAQLLITGEAKHDQMIDGKNAGLSTLQLGHQESEQAVLPFWKNSISSLFPQLELEVYWQPESKLMFF